MNNAPGWVRALLFILTSFCLGVYLEFWPRLSGFSILGHTYTWRPGRMCVAAFILLPLILGLWALSSGVMSALARAKYGRVMSLDSWTYLPLVFFGLTPLVLGHYLSRQDLSLRLTLLAVIIGGAVLILKVLVGLRLRRERDRLGPGLVKKFEALPRGKRLAALLVIALVLYAAGSVALRSKGVNFSGDEPHYLLIAHSLVHDRDFDLKNNYEAKDYERYMAPGVTTTRHVIKRAESGPWYSFHSPGTAIVLLPFYAIGEILGLGREALIFLLRFGMSLLGALFGLQLYLFARREWGRERLALGLWFLVSFTSPVFFYSIHVYPEIIVALLGLMEFRLARHTESWTARRLIASGFVLSFIVWFHALKYLFLLAPLLAYLVWTVWKRSRKRLEVLYVLIGPVLVGSVYLFFQRSLYGSLSPSAISVKGALSGSESLSYLKFLVSGIPWRFRWETLAGYFLDQKDGLLLYAPVYFFAFLGAALLLKRRKSGFWAVAFVAGPYVLVSAFLTQRTGYAPQARPLVAVIWALAICLGAFLAENRKRLFGLLAACAAFVSFTVVVLLLLNPLALYQETTEGTTERGGAFFNQLSNLHYSLRDVLPSFIKVEGTWLPNFVWLGLLVLFVAAYLLWPREEFRLSSAGQTALVLLLTGLLCFWFAYFPRDMLLDPVRVDLPGGRLDFYSLSRAAKMTQPARFLLVQDNRVFHFSFTSRQPLRELGLEFGSTRGNYAVSLTLFDEVLVRDRTRHELKAFTSPGPPAYRLGRVYLYCLDVNLLRKSSVSTGENPYLLAIRPSW